MCATTDRVTRLTISSIGSSTVGFTTVSVVGVTTLSVTCETTVGWLGSGECSLSTLDRSTLDDLFDRDTLNAIRLREAKYVFASSMDLAVMSTLSFVGKCL